MAKEWFKEIKAVGFDLDGTLYPADAIPAGTLDKAAVARIVEQLKINPEEAKRVYQDKVDILGSHTKALIELGVKGEKFYTDLWDDLPLEQWIKKDDKMVELINSLSDKYRLFVLSNSNRLDQIERKLNLIGLHNTDFEFIVDTISLGSVKPDPEPFIKCIELLILTANEVLYVGDRIETDVTGAKSVGMRAALVGVGITAMNKGKNQTNADWVGEIYDLEEVLNC
jgi:putative hydrolase of the HAD superfamily